MILKKTSLTGKLNRGLAVIESYKLLKAGSEPSEDEVFLACILGWGIEWVCREDASVIEYSETMIRSTMWDCLTNCSFG
jgi:hypothetical protein